MSLIFLVLVALFAFWFLKGFFKYVLPAILLLIIAKFIFGLAFISLHLVLFVIGLLIIVWLIRAISGSRNR
ncbi:hypothetical protein [Lactococcus termiticola]|uniref:Uncharacterized protein n=1 Tax=Lactococcus termiticola TaxID=2169526 RepID=A0A2R5HJJ8_9LACT|nr:hypothetical protein [Lactococcus termiticola]GBG96780.1 hypothetical protein NtB2_00904 [Lactococcus termiticola]